jgi:anaerobic selenocysteine-containing dehydrogenase
MVVVDPNFSGTASKADTWLQIRPGTDAALGLAMAREILAAELADLDFLRDYTDAPLLVRLDTGVRLRDSDLRAGGDATRFAIWDERTSRVVRIGTDRLGMPAGTRAALAGTFRARLTDGSTVEVAPGFELVRRELDAWTLDRGAEVTGIGADSIGRLAHAYATTKPAAILMGGGSNHWFHGDLTGRAMGLLAALTGNIGVSGGGFSVYVGQYKVRVNVGPWFNPGGEKAHIVPSIYFVRGRSETMHPDVPYPANGFHGLVVTFANMFVQAPDVNRLHETLRGLDLVVVVDHQMTETVKWADVVLPAATWYEKTDLTATPLHPFLQRRRSSPSASRAPSCGCGARSCAASTRPRRASSWRSPRTRRSR